MTIITLKVFFQNIVTYDAMPKAKDMNQFHTIRLNTSISPGIITLHQDECDALYCHDWVSVAS